MNALDSNKFGNGNGMKTDGPAPVKQDSTTSENLVLNHFSIFTTRLFISISTIFQSASLVPTSNEVHSSRSASPRRLIKQVALESPPPAIESSDYPSRIFDLDRRTKIKDHVRIQRDKPRKDSIVGLDGPLARRTESW